MQTTFFAPLRKVEDADDGSITVYGIASTETRDSTGELILASAIRKALPAYKRYPAIREMHGLHAAGRAIEIDVDDEGVTHLVAHIVDPNAVRKVKSKTYAGFSVGGKVVSRDKKDPTVITEIVLSEISLVDRPCQAEAAISMWKIDGIAADLAKVTGERDTLEKAVSALGRRAESTLTKVQSVVAENQRLRAELKRLTPRDAAVNDVVDHGQFFAKADHLELIVAKAEREIADLARRFHDAG